MLPNENYHWVETEDGAFLQWRYACVALVRARKKGEDFNRVEIYARRFIQSRAGSVEQGKRHIERWVAKQTKFPPMGGCRGAAPVARFGARPDSPPTHP